MRSMLRKACSPNNTACEGFFWRLKNELFYAKNWLAKTIDQFIAELDALRPLLEQSTDEGVARLTQPAGAPQGSGDRCPTSPSFLPHLQVVSFRLAATVWPVKSGERSPMTASWVSFHANSAAVQPHDSFQHRARLPLAEGGRSIR